MNSPLVEQLGPGFVIEMRDGSRYFIPPEKWVDWYVEDTMSMKKDLDAQREPGEPRLTKKIAREWAHKHLSGEWHTDASDQHEFFDGTEWSKFADVAIRLPDKPRLTPEELWDETAEITFVLQLPSEI